MSPWKPVASSPTVVERIWQKILSQRSQCLVNWVLLLQKRAQTPTPPPLNTESEVLPHHSYIHPQHCLFEIHMDIWNYVWGKMVPHPKSGRAKKHFITHTGVLVLKCAASLVLPPLDHLPLPAINSHLF